MTGGRCSEVDLVLKLLGRDLEWPLMTGGRYSEVVVSTGLTVLVLNFKKSYVLGPLDNNWAEFRKYKWVIWGPPKECC